MADNISRRKFVTNLAVAGTGVTIVPRHVLGRGFRAPSDRLNVACIGVGGMGENDVKGMSDENIVALCDVDDQRAKNSYERHPKARRYKDFREMLEKESANIDAVTVSTPDHVHAAATIMALRLGKHVYCQKPLTRTVEEVRAVMAAARSAGVVTQMGNQGHASEDTRRLREWIEAGAIGTVRRVEFWTNRPVWPQGVDRPTEAHHVPSTLDWDLWLGPAADRPYHPGYAPFNWRGWWDFGTGAMGDMACHLMDAAFWTLGLRYPARVSPEFSQLHDETGPKASRIEYEFPARGGRPAITLVWRDGGLAPARPFDWPAGESWPHASSGQLWIGDGGTLVAGTYGGDPRLSDPDRNAAIQDDPPAEKYPRTDGVHEEWTQAIRDGAKAGSDFVDHAGPLTEMILLGNLAVRTGQALELDPATGRILRPSLAPELIGANYRDGWVL